MSSLLRSEAVARRRCQAPGEALKCGHQSIISSSIHRTHRVHSWAGLEPCMSGANNPGGDQASRGPVAPPLRAGQGGLEHYPAQLCGDGNASNPNCPMWWSLVIGRSRELECGSSSRGNKMQMKLNSHIWPVPTRLEGAGASLRTCWAMRAP